MTAERTPDARVEAERRHSIVNVSHRGILGGYVNHCSCGASVVEPEGGHEATDAHLAGPPDAPRKPRTYRQGYIDGKAAADAVQREGLTERVAEALDAHRLAPIDEHQDWTCRCDEVIAYAGLHLDLRPLIIAHQSAAVVAAIYGTRP